MRFEHPWAFERGTLWAMELTGKAPAQAVPRTIASFGEVTPEAAGPLAQAMGHGDPSEVLWRFESGRRCFAAWVGESIACYGWVSRGEEHIGELERTFRMRSGEAYIWDCATLPPFQRQGLYSALLSYIASTLREEEFRRLWIGASLQNRTSIRGFASAGFQPVITLTYARLFTLRHMWIFGDRTAALALVQDARRSMLGLDEPVGKVTMIGAAARSEPADPSSDNRY